MSEDIAEEYEFLLNSTEMKIVRHCLDYCYHRLQKHPECGLKDVVTVSQVDRLRKELI